MKLPYVNLSESLFFVSMYLNCILGVQNDSIEQPIKSNSVVSRNMSHCRASSLENHLDHCFVVLIHVQQTKLPGEKSFRLMAEKSSLSRSLIIQRGCEVLNEPHVGSYTSLSVLDYSDSCFQEFRRSNPQNR